MAITERPDPEPLLIDHLAILDDGHRRSWHPGRFQYVRDVRIEFRQLLVR